MPNGIFPVPAIQPNPAEASGRGRAAPLAGSFCPRRSARLANRLVTLLGDARRSSLGPFRKKTRARHAAIRRSTDDLMALVLRLRDGEPITARGAAMTALLVDRRRARSAAEKGATCSTPFGRRGWRSTGPMRTYPTWRPEPRCRGGKNRSRPAAKEVWSFRSETTPAAGADPRTWSPGAAHAFWEPASSRASRSARTRVRRGPPRAHRACRARLPTGAGGADPGAARAREA